MGLLLSLQYVHFVEYKLGRVRYSYIRLVGTLGLIFGFIEILARTGGYEDRHWSVGILFIMTALASIFISSYILLKKKNIRFLGKRH